MISKESGCVQNVTLSILPQTYTQLPLKFSFRALCFSTCACTWWMHSSRRQFLVSELTREQMTPVVPEARFTEAIQRIQELPVYLQNVSKGRKKCQY